MYRLLLPLGIGLCLVMASCSSLPTSSLKDLPPTVKLSESGDWLLLEPAEGSSRRVGLIFYPGGLVKPEAYLLALAPIAQAGYPVVIVKMPFDLAFFDAEKGLAAQRALPTVEHWVIGGHSLGGVASAIAVDKHPEAFSGIVFLASYPAEANDLSRLTLPGLSISASQDGLSTPAKIQAASRLLPVQTKVVTIEGGNHAQFADYGPQKGDGEASITRAVQQAATAREVLEFLGTL